MNNNRRRLLTIITESSLETKLTRIIEQLGAHGYTITDARGKGSSGEREADWDADSNIRIEVICSTSTAEAIAAYMQEKYYDDFAMIIYMHDVDVLRPTKF